MPEEPLYFGDPATAVERINDLLGREEWATLARYYDLTGSELTIEDVSSWEWFEYGGEPVADPSGRGGPHHPFPKGATYREHMVDGDRSWVTVELDAGLAEVYAGPAEVRFPLARQDEGWQLLAPDDDRLTP